MEIVKEIDHIYYQNPLTASVFDNFCHSRGFDGHIGW